MVSCLTWKGGTGWWRESRSGGMGAPLLVEDDAFGGGMRLAGQSVSGGDVGGLQGVVGVHPHLALDDLGPAGAAHPVLAGEGGVGPVPEGGVEDRGAVFGKLEALRAPVEHDGDRGAGFRFLFAFPGGRAV